jgi:hypothetical protein
MIMNAIPAHHRFPVRKQTAKATRAVRISTKSKRITKIITKPIIIKPMNPRDRNQTKPKAPNPKILLKQ